LIRSAKSGRHHAQKNFNSSGKILAKAALLTGAFLFAILEWLLA
jgi:hypothetical protein